MAASAPLQPVGFDAPRSIDPGFGELIGSSLRMLEVFEDLHRSADAKVSGLIEGEVGTRQRARSSIGATKEDVCPRTWESI
jgi:hypothetical protein